MSEEPDTARPLYEVLWEIAHEVIGMEIQIESEWGDGSDGTPVGDRLNRLANHLAEVPRG